MFNWYCIIYLCLILSWHIKVYPGTLGLACKSAQRFVLQAGSVKAVE